MIAGLPYNDSPQMIEIFVMVIRVTKTGLLARSRPCGRTTCGCLTGCKKVLSIDAKKKGYLVKHVIYSDVDDDLNRYYVMESINDLVTTPDDYESRGSVIRSTCQIS